MAARRGWRLLALSSLAPCMTRLCGGPASRDVRSLVLLKPSARLASPWGPTAQRRGKTSLQAENVRRLPAWSACPTLAEEEGMPAAAAARMSVLKERIKHYMKPPVCRGSTQTSRKVAVRLLAAEGEPLVWFSEGGNLSTLIEACEDAPYGKGLATVHNKSVRDALQLQAKDFKLQGVDAAAMQRILETVETTLLGKTGGRLEAEPYCLNVYEEGCFFKAHQDTYRSSETRQMVGTLLLELPPLYTGGELVLTHGGQETLALLPRSQYDPKNLQWCAFFGDVAHEVQMVRSGVRVTVSYFLWRRFSEDDDQELPPSVRELAKDLKREANTRQAGDPHALSWSCHHMYTEEEFPEPAKPDIRKLKGIDRVMAQAAVEAGLPVRMQKWLRLRDSMDTSDIGEPQEVNKDVVQVPVSHVDREVLERGSLWKLEPDAYEGESEISRMVLEQEHGIADISFGMVSHEFLTQEVDFDVYLHTGNHGPCSLACVYRFWKVVIDFGPDGS